MAQLETPPGEDSSQETARPNDTPSAVSGGRRFRSGRYEELHQHELVMLLDEVDAERSRARFRESVYISVIVWLILGWVIVYGPRYLWHPPVIVQAPPDRRSAMTDLDTPPDLKKFTKPTRPTPNISEKSTSSQSPKPSPQAPEPRAGNPAPPAPKPTPQPAQPRQQTPQPQQPQPQPQQQQQPQQQPRNTPPTPQPSRTAPPLADAPSASPTANRNIFGGQKSAGESIADAARGARSGEGGDYGSTGRGQQGGTKQGVQVLSDMQGVDFSKYLARLLSDVRRNWLPLIPEECRPPLNKQGITGVRFTILPDGHIAPNSMKLDYSTHDVAIDRAAWGSITGLGQAQPLPKEFHGPNLELRIEFRINKDGQGDAQ
ncbi:cell envelope integrity protein TolA [Terriglobus roseus]|uniref:TonB family protein n=1 Tax=Terriglobus roseus TaxID=392734 RepID=A0A1H4P4T1_9BACT|nr:cell envelope integrity protein TolA [Terriglobus roseus]SEC02334.1 hypothetical protein SAMN05443244_2450 [Terriglobus roseus]